MRLLVAGDFRWNSGSSHVIREYVRHGPALGIEIAVSSELGSRDCIITKELPFRSGLRWATHLLVVLEGNAFISQEQLGQIERAIPRSHRAVIDADGHWGPTVRLGGDDNTWPCGSETWEKQIRELADLILQPCLKQPSPGAVSFPYFGVSAPSKRSVPRPRGNRLHMQYIGSNWFRFAALTEVFSVARAVLPLGAKLRVRGKYWNGDFRPGFEAATKANTETLRQLRVEVGPCVPFGDVVRRMGDATVTPVLVRPLIGALGFLTPRMFETVTARTIPVYRQEDSYISELYHDDRYFCLGKTDAKMHDVFQEEEKLDEILEEVRRHIQRDYSYMSLLTRLRDLLS